MLNYLERILAGRRRGRQPNHSQSESERYTIFASGSHVLENAQAQLFLQLRPDFNFAYNNGEEDFDKLYDYLPPRLIEEIKREYSGILMSVMLPESPTYGDGAVIPLKGVEVRLKKKLSFTIDERGGLEGSRPVLRVVVYGYLPTSVYIG